MGNHSLDPGVIWPMDTKQQHPLLGPGCRALRVALRALSQTLIAPTSTLYSQACCVTPGQSHDLSRPTSASFTHLHDLDHIGLPDLVSYSWPIGLGYIQLCVASGLCTDCSFFLECSFPRSWSLPFFVSQPKCHLLEEAFPNHPRRHGVSPALQCLHTLSDLGA